MFVLLFILWSSSGLANHHEQFYGETIHTCSGDSKSKSYQVVVNNKKDGTSIIKLFRTSRELSSEFSSKLFPTSYEFNWEKQFDGETFLPTVNCIDSHYFSVSSMTSFTWFIVGLSPNQIVQLDGFYAIRLEKAFKLQNNIYAFRYFALLRNGGTLVIDLDTSKVLYKTESGMHTFSSLVTTKDNTFLSMQKTHTADSDHKNLYLSVSAIDENNQLVHVSQCNIEASRLVYNWEELLEQHPENPDIIFTGSYNAAFSPDKNCSKLLKDFFK